MRTLRIYRAMKETDGESFAQNRVGFYGYFLHWWRWAAALYPTILAKDVLDDGNFMNPDKPGLGEY